MIDAILFHLATYPCCRAYLLALTRFFLFQILSALLSFDPQLIRNHIRDQYKVACFLCCDTITC